MALMEDTQLSMFVISFYHASWGHGGIIDASVVEKYRKSMMQTIEEQPPCDMGDANDVPQEDALSACKGAP